MSDLTFFTNPQSRGRIVRWMLEELDLDYDTEVIDYGPAMSAPAYSAINPMAKVPAIRHRGTIVTEVAAICTYLADAYPDAGLAPAPGSTQRGAYYRWMFFGAGPLEQAVVNTSFGWTTDDPREQGRTGYGSLARVARALEGQLADGRPYMLGDSFSTVDVYVGSQIVWGLQFNTFPESEIFSRYAEGLLARPKAAVARAKDDALVKKQG